MTNLAQTRDTCTAIICPTQKGGGWLAGPGEAPPPGSSPF